MPAGLFFVMENQRVFIPWDSMTTHLKRLGLDFGCVVDEVDTGLWSNVVAYDTTTRCVLTQCIPRDRDKEIPVTVTCPPDWTQYEFPFRCVTVGLENLGFRFGDEIRHEAGTVVRAVAFAAGRLWTTIDRDRPELFCWDEATPEELRGMFEA